MRTFLTLGMLGDFRGKKKKNYRPSPWKHTLTHTAICTPFQEVSGFMLPQELICGPMNFGFREITNTI